MSIYLKFNTQNNLNTIIIFGARQPCNTQQNKNTNQMQYKTKCWAQRDYGA